MNICTNCKHHKKIRKPSGNPFYDSICGYMLPEVDVCCVEQIVDLVDGKPLYRLCGVMRKKDGKCGVNGKLFEGVTVPAP